ncbi:hypothetical protein AAEX63_06145 [Luteococcus sp. H138]|uniref:hypothetical protein n=1 Tax=unclassified Luteococcus TaxID=2639923 RepID=UPI00313CFC69
MRFVVYQGPGEDACSAELARALVGENHQAELAVGSAPPLGPDDWLHVAGVSALSSDGARQVLGLMAGAPAAVSAHLAVDALRCMDPDSMDPDSLWPQLEALLHTIGDVGGLLFIRDVDLAWLCADPQLDPAETADDWAEAYGLGLCVVTRGMVASAVKPDGRRVEVLGGRVIRTPQELAAFAAGFLRSYVHNPADLAAALTMGLG